jgi:quercetin dioxygenase-like cupin family protein
MMKLLLAGYLARFGSYNFSFGSALYLHKEKEMITEALKLEKKNLSRPDVTRDCGHGTLELVLLEDTPLARFTLQPGWKWSEHVRPMAGTESCQMRHLQYVISGRLRIVQDDGTKFDLVPGDFASIPPGHDGLVLGDEPFVCIDFSPDMKQYAEH